jgi:hypothetical protein
MSGIALGESEDCLNGTRGLVAGVLETPIGGLYKDV